MKVAVAGRGVTMTVVGLGVSVGVEVGLDVSGALVGLAVGGSDIPVGLAVSGSGVPSGLAVGSSGVLVSIWTIVGLGVGESVESGSGGVLVGSGVGDLATADIVRVTEGTGLPAGDIGVGVAVVRDVGVGGPKGEDGLLKSVSFLATSVPDAHITMPANSAPIVRIASKGNNRSRFI